MLGVCLFCWNFDIFLVNSQKLGPRQAPENIELKKLISNLTFTSFLLFLYMLVFYNIVPMFLKK